MLPEACLTITYSLLNRLRGWGRYWWGNKTLVSVYMVLSFWGPFALFYGVAPTILPFNPIVAFVLLVILDFALTRLGYTFGWGKYFPDRINKSHEKEEPVTDWLTDKILGKYTATSSESFGLRWKTLAMALRHTIWFAPRWAVIALFTGKYAVLLGIPLMGIIGGLYLLAYSVRSKKQTETAELLAGAYYGLLNGVIVWRNLVP